MSSSSSPSAVRFRTSNGRYIGSRDGLIVAIATKIPVVGEAAAHQPITAAEDWTVRVTKDGTVTLRQGNQFLGVDAAGRAALVDESYEWKMTKTPDGRVAFQTPEDRFLSPAGGGGGDVVISRRGMKTTDALLPSIDVEKWAKPRAAANGR